jgi:hypothetical protein
MVIVSRPPIRPLSGRASAFLVGGKLGFEEF